MEGIIQKPRVTIEMNDVKLYNSKSTPGQRIVKFSDQHGEKWMKHTSTNNRKICCCMHCKEKVSSYYEYQSDMFCTKCAGEMFKFEDNPILEWEEVEPE